MMGREMTNDHVGDVLHLEVVNTAARRGEVVEDANFLIHA